MQSLFFVPTRFVWRFGGRQVHLCGSFTRWVETVPMAPVDNSPGVFAVVVHLPPGYHQYKFIVDGKWRHDETAPFMPDPLGNVNNWLFVRRIEPSPSQPSGAFESQSAPAQQQGQPSASQPQPQPGTSAGLQPVANPASSSGAIAASSGTGVGPNWQNSISSTGLPVTGPLPAATQGDVDMANAEAIVAPIVVHNPKEPEYTQKKVGDFMNSHTAYELIPESGKVVVLDVDLPVRQAFHALHEQGIASAPLWDGVASTFPGVISASDFISILTGLRKSITAGASPLSEDEMDVHTIRALREQAASEGREPKPLIYVKPEDRLGKVVATLAANKCSMAPIFNCDPLGPEVPAVLHLCTLSGVLACLMRHFRASLASLPLLSQPLGSLPLGTWSPDAGVAHMDVLPDSKDRRQWRKLQPLHTVTPDTLLTTALTLLLETGVSALPVVDEKRSLIDIYARADITRLCQNNLYKHLQWEDVTVRHALSLSPSPASAPMAIPAPQSKVPSHPMLVMGGISASLNPQQPPPSERSVVHAGPGPGGRGVRVHVCSKDDTLRTVVERLAIPGVRRLVVVAPDTRRVEGVVSLSDVAAYLFL